MSMGNKKTHVVIVGGGAAGLAAAIAAAREGARVSILEAGKRVGQKILKTGNGRCNFTNMRVHPSDYNNPEFVAPVINAWSAGSIREFFETLGMMSLEESEGRVYPFSNSANTVLDVLRAECGRLGVVTFCEHEVIDMEKTDKGFELVCDCGARVTADRVVVATGGGSWLLSKMGHAIIPSQPVLCPLGTNVKPLKGLSGIRAKAQVSAFASSLSGKLFFQERGEVLFRDYGVSGIVIFDVSCLAKAGDWLSLDFMPDIGRKELISWLAGRFEVLDSPTYAELMCGLLQTRLNDAMARAVGCKPTESVRAENIPALANAIKHFDLEITGCGDVKQAQATRGGANVAVFDAHTLGSTLQPGLYAAGETLDVDARCGGFNLHWAWASGITAGTAAAEG